MADTLTGAAFAPAAHTPALVGMGMRLPGPTDSVPQLWDLLSRGDCAIAPYPAHRWEAMQARLHPDDRPAAPWQAGTVEDPPFDCGHFELPAAQAQQLDRLQRLLLEAAADALADAGIPLRWLRERRVALYIASASVDAAAERFTDGRRTTIADVLAGGPGMLATPLMRWLDSTGPQMSVDTACSSSLTALHLARQAIKADDIDVALVAGLNSADNPMVTSAFQDAGVLAPEGRCKPFDSRADGYVRSEGAAVAVVQPWEQAVCDRSRVYALIAHTVLGSDGRAPGGAGTPYAAAQERVTRRCYDEAGIPPAAVGYVEAHGTGTSAGDSVEARALQKVFGRSREEALAIGSAKGSLGHLEGAAPLVGVLGAALALCHRTRFPTAGHSRLRPSIDRLGGLRVLTETEKWDTGPVQVAGVNALGFGGGLGHAALASPPPAPSDESSAAAGPVVVPVSASTRSALADTAHQWARALSRTGDLGQVASTAALRRDHHRVRAAVVASSATEAAEVLRSLASGAVHPNLVSPGEAPSKRRRVVLVFAGQGTQLPAMGADVVSEPAYVHAVRQVQEALAAHPGHRPWQPGTVPHGVAAVQQAVFTHQVGLAALLVPQLRPDAVIGHSLGELAAAHTAGILTLDDAARVVCARSILLEQAAEHGGLLATALTLPETLTVLADYPGLDVAALNSPHLTLVSGSFDSLDRLHRRLEEERVWARRVPAGPPAHSRMLNASVDVLSSTVAGLAPAEGAMEFVSTLKGGGQPGRTLDGAYWCDQLRNTVEFQSAVEVSAAREPSVFVEVGGRSVLAEAITTTLAAEGLPGAVVAARGDHPAGEHAGMLAQLGAAYTHGILPASWTEPDDARPAELGPICFDRTTAPDAVGAADLAAELPERVRGLVADLVGHPLTAADDHTPLDELGVSSSGRLQLRLGIATLHPRFGAPDALARDHDPTIAGITTALRPLLAPADSADPAA